MKTINQTFLDLLHSDAIDSALVALLDFTLPDTSHLRYARHASDVTYGGNVYTTWPFEAQLLSVGRGAQVVTVTLTIVDAVQELRPHAIATSWFRNTTLTITVMAVAYPLLDYDWSTQTYDILHAVPQGDDLALKLGGPNPVKMRFPPERYWAEQCPFAKGFKDDPRCGYSGVETTCDGTLADCIARSRQTRFGGFMGLDPDAARLVLPAGLRGL